MVNKWFVFAIAFGWWRFKPIASKIKNIFSLDDYPLGHKKRKMPDLLFPATFEDALNSLTTFFVFTKLERFQLMPGQNWMKLANTIRNSSAILKPTTSGPHLLSWPPFYLYVGMCLIQFGIVWILTCRICKTVSHTQRHYMTKNISERNLALISVYRLNLNIYLHQFARVMLQRRFHIHFSDKVAAESKKLVT